MFDYIISRGLTQKTLKLILIIILKLLKCTR